MTISLLSPKIKNERLLRENIIVPSTGIVTVYILPLVDENVKHIFDVHLYSNSKENNFLIQKEVSVQKINGWWEYDEITVSEQTSGIYLGFNIFSQKFYIQVFGDGNGDITVSGEIRRKIINLI